MALLPKKTYSKRNNDYSLMCEKEKENIDPFDELLSSPLKQKVQFQPLSYWGKKKKNSKPKKESEKMKYGLYEISDSDELNSPYQRGKNCKSKNSVSKARILQKKVIQKQYESVNCKLNIKKDDFSTSYSHIKRITPVKSISLNENEILMSSEVLVKNEDWSSNCTLYYDENVEETLLSSYSICDNIKYCTNKSKQDFSNVDYNNNSNGTFSGFLPSCKLKKKNVKDSNEFFDNINPNHSKFEMHGNASSTVEQIGDFNDLEEVINDEDKVNITLTFDEKTERTSSPFFEDLDNHKFISVKRYFNYPNFSTFYGNYNNSLKSVKSKKMDISSDQSWSETENSFNTCHLKAKPCENTYIQAESTRSTNNETYVYNKEDLMDSSLGFNDSMDENHCIVNHIKPKSEVFKSIPMFECHDENILSDTLDFSCLSNQKIEDLIQEFIEQQNSSITAEDSSSNTDDTLLEFKDKDSGTKVSLHSKEDDIKIRGSDIEKEIIHFNSTSSGVSLLTTGISDLTISNAAGDELMAVDKFRVTQHNRNFGEKDSFLLELRNVTTKRRGRFNDTYEKNVPCAINRQIYTSEAQNGIHSITESKFEQTFEFSRITNRMSVDCDKSIFLANPLFESTRVVDMGFTDGKISQKHTNIMGGTCLGGKFTLKPGKKWLRSISVLKQLQNRSLIEERLDSTRIRGRKFESFIQDIMEMQNDQSGFFLSSVNFKVADNTFMNSVDKNSFLARLSGYKTLLGRESIRENELKMNKFLIVDDSVFSKGSSYTVLEKSVLHHTIKIIESKEGPSYFRSALGLAVDHSSILDESVQNGCSAVSAKDFILMQCGQDDVLSFEEHFNERTLKNGKKIGEGVYGEVFMSCDSVLKIIPIEGSEKVNGEPQKTFEEIISEVVVASKLSNLRREERFRTDGFSELKRCWCVKGKYPEYLLKLWNEYDQLGSGSENDSPVMFKDNQLYIILELANGGKDLESFVFTSSAQSLSIFIQAAFSLAAAEKAYEFEHRDLHWGNVLISETQKKYISIILDGAEYRIPTRGVQVCIIDFTLSRINHEGCCIFNDLSIDPGLFASEGDYQFEIYRMMLAEVKNDWSLFRPKTNLFWLHYMLDKMIKMVRYKNKRAKVHLKHLKDLKTLESVILEFKDSTNFVLNESLSNVISKL